MPATAVLSKDANNEYQQIWMPIEYNRDQTRRAIVWCHGAGSDFTLGPIEKYIASNGFPIIACDLGGTLTWGNDTSLQRITDKWTYMVTNYGVKPDKMILWGASMGSLTAMLYALDHPENVEALGVALPIMDPEDVRSNNRGGYQAAIEAVYGTGTAVPDTKRPITRAASLIPQARIWVSEDDSIGQPSIADAFVSSAPSGRVTRSSMGAHGHSYLTLDWQDAIAWLIPHR